MQGLRGTAALYYLLVYPWQRFILPSQPYLCSLLAVFRGAGAGPAGTAAAGPMLEAKLMNLINGWLQKF